MNKFTTAVLAACLALSGAAHAQDAMKKDDMKKDGMAKDAMKK